MKQLIEVRNGYRSFKQKVVLQDVNLCFENQMRYALVGPNGVGKTTLINTLANVLALDKGEIFIDGIDLSNKINRNSIYVILAGDRGLHWRISARQNIEYFLALRGIGKKATQALVAQHIEIFGMKQLIDTRIEEMSFGQKKKVLLFIGFICGASTLIIDEITEGLDIDSREELKANIAFIASQNKTVIFATHDLGFAKESADKVVFLETGRISSPIDIADDTDLMKIYKEKKGSI